MKVGRCLRHGRLSPKNARECLQNFGKTVVAQIGMGYKALWAAHSQVICQAIG